MHTYSDSKYKFAFSIYMQHLDVATHKGYWKMTTWIYVKHTNIIGQVSITVVFRTVTVKRCK